MPASQRYTLSELNNEIKDTLSENFRESLWVVAEIARVTPNYSGHTYMDLVEKRGSETLAQAKATIWRSNAKILAEYASAAGQPLKQGVQVLLLVRLEYHPVYGLSLNVLNIDANYTLGEMARRRQEVIIRLQAEGLFDKNKTLELELVPQNVAVISSATAAGWEDFRRRIEDNPYGYLFKLTLYNAMVQGDGAEASVMAAFKKIIVEQRVHKFDVVVVIRGGGGVVDLSCFDNYNVAMTIANCELPVITGIGHERDTAVADMVSYHRADTPTAAAEYLISRVNNFDYTLQEVTNDLVDITKSLLINRGVEFNAITTRLLSASRSQLDAATIRLDQSTFAFGSVINRVTGEELRVVTRLSARMEMRSADYIPAKHRELESLILRLGTSTNRHMDRSKQLLDKTEQSVLLRDPKEILSRGFTITRVNGKPIRSQSEVVPGARLETILSDGTVISTAE